MEKKMKKETKAQRVERIKKEKDGLDVLKDIHRYAQTGEAVDPEDIDRFKWYGLYTQNRNLQAEDDATLYFMLRIKVPNAQLNLEQLKVLSEISAKYARGSADFTTRQNVQLHFIRVADLPAIFALLTSVGLSSIFAAGDVPRNIVTCPVNGIDHLQIADVREIVKEIDVYFDGNRELSNLPRKYKVGISGCHKHCISHEIQDLSFSATKNKDNEVLFDVHVGGGLASNKRIATHIGYVTKEQIIHVVKAVSEIYNESGNRDNRHKARVGHIVEEFGVEKFLEALHVKLDFTLLPRVSQEYTHYKYREHFGIHKSLETDKSYIGCAVNGGSIGAKGLENIYKILKEYGATKIKTTTTQNFVIIDAPTQNVIAIANALKEIDIEINPSPFKARTLSCTGMKFCKFAVSETKDLTDLLIKHLEKKFPNFEESISFSLNGCPNSCAHSHIVDIGLVGCKVKKDDVTVSGFELILGGYLQGDKSSFAKNTGIKFASEETLEVIENLINEYKESGYSSFYDFVDKRNIR